MYCAQFTGEIPWHYSHFSPVRNTAVEKALGVSQRIRRLPCMMLISLTHTTLFLWCGVNCSVINSQSADSRMEVL